MKISKNQICNVLLFSHPFVLSPLYPKKRTATDLKVIDLLIIESLFFSPLVFCLVGGKREKGIRVYLGMFPKNSQKTVLKNNSLMFSKTNICLRTQNVLNPFFYVYFQIFLKNYFYIVLYLQSFFIFVQLVFRIALRK